MFLIVARLNSGQQMAVETSSTAAMEAKISEYLASPQTKSVRVYTVKDAFDALRKTAYTREPVGFPPFVA